MALHLSEGAIHAVQTPFAYLGYKMLNGMAKKPLKGIPESDICDIENGTCSPTISTLEALADGIGKKLVISIE